VDQLLLNGQPVHGPSSTCPKVYPSKVYSSAAKVSSIEISVCGQLYQPKIYGEKYLVARDFANSKTVFNPL
jgi:hypothetical protein